MKNIAMICLAVSLLMLGLHQGAGASDAPAEPVEFEAPEDGLSINFIKGHSEADHAVEFNHSSHESYECIDCHHKMGELKGNEPPRSCASCHDNFSPDNLKGYKSYFKAMHKIRFEPNAARPSCLHCHTSEFGADDKDMTGCTASGCHTEGIR